MKYWLAVRQGAGSSGSGLLGAGGSGAGDDTLGGKLKHAFFNTLGKVAGAVGNAGADLVSHGIKTGVNMGKEAINASAREHMHGSGEHAGTWSFNSCCTAAGPGCGFPDYTTTHSCCSGRMDRGR
eukprot:g16619.t1